jgi:hypothetical protein
MLPRSRLWRTTPDLDAIETTRLIAGYRSTGEPVYEEVPIERVGDTMRVLATPGMANGVAADDLIEIHDGVAVVVSRGGNVGVQVLQPAASEADANRLVDMIEGIAGWLDGFDPRGIIALSVPATAGFPVIERVLADYVDTVPGATYSYTNVYADDEGLVPLNWWLA